MSRRKLIQQLDGGTQHQTLVVGEAPDVFEPHKTQRVVRNMREHPLTFLAHRGLITDVQLLAGDAFRRHYETAILGAARAIDYTRVRVDGGQPAEPLTERMQDAHRWLNEAARVPGVGAIGYSVLRSVAGEGKLVRDVAATWPGSSRSNEIVLMARLREALDAVAEHFGMVAVGKAKRR